MRTVVREEILLSDLTAIADDKGNRATYKELAEKAEGIGKYIEERSLILILCDHQMETLEFIYMMLYLNRVPLLLASDINEEMLEHLTAVYKPQYIYCSHKENIHGRYHHELGLKNHVLVETNRTGYETHPELALLLSTSGTTGSAKLVRLSYANLYDNAKQVCLHLGIKRGQKGLSPLPFYHVYGLTFCIQHWHCGATVLVTEELAIGRKFHDFYIRERANNFAATPYTYHMLQKIRFWDQEKLNYLHCALCAGAQIPKEEHKELVSIMQEKFWNMYGTTESTAIVLGIHFNENSMKLGSIGKAVGNVKTDVEHGTNELVIKSKSVCMGYAEHGSQLAEGDINHGILHTGDVVCVDEDGCFYITGRLKRFVKILDRRISLDDIESYLNNKYADIDFACIGKDDRIFLFYTEMENMSDKEVSSLLDRSMKIPSRFVSFMHLKSLPRNETGKTDYRRLEGMISYV